MYPILFEIFNFQIGTYGLLYAISFLVALRVGVHYGRREGIESARILDLGIYTLLAGIIGAKLLLYVVDFRLYFTTPGEMLRTWRAAGMFYGGLIVAIGVGLLYLRRHRLPVLTTTDVVAPAVALGQAIGRLGCFTAGCCYGIGWTGPGAVTFREPDAHTLTGVPLDLPLVPTQLLHAAASFLIFIVLVLVYRKKTRPGTVFWLFLVLHGLSRFGLEFLRGDYRGPQIAAGLTVSQIMALAAIGLGAWMLVRNRRTPEAAPAGGRS
jgi:phosphatidylglycerol:prolipoprotein diacylglycerol transferase